MLCTRCKKRQAIVFVQRMEGSETKNEGYCLTCARELHIKPLDDMMQRFGVSDQDLEGMEERMNDFMKEMGENGQMPEGMFPMPTEEPDGDGEDGEDGFTPGGSPVFPFGFGSRQKKEDEEGEKGKKGDRKPKKRKFLTNYCEDLTGKAKAGKLDAIIGRDAEIYRTIQILCRRQKNNPCLIGEAGVGKTAIAEGIAQRIAGGNVPARLRDKELFLLDLTALVAGTQFRGQFEQRVKGLISEVKAAGNIILFIDEIHNITGAGDSEGAMNAANILKPALSRGEIQVIGATTFTEYRKYIEKDQALERRFQPVKVEEPSLADTITLMQGIKGYYESYHKVKVPADVLNATVSLSERYITDRFLPDKAIDLLDEACACCNLRHPELTRWQETQEKVAELEKQQMSLEQTPTDEPLDYEQLANLRTELARLRDELPALEAQVQNIAVSMEDVARVIELWTGIPAVKIKESEFTKLQGLEGALKAKIIGQDEAVAAVARAVRRARAGLKDPRRPIGSFIFLGPTGVGKTELCKALAEALFGDENSMIRIDMSEYMEKHTVSRMIGSPPGYVGFDEGGQLTEKVRRHPYSVLLFDEVEKAHPDVFNVLLQILEDGRLTDGQGRVVDFKNTVIVMTSNAGAHLLKKQRTMGFGSAADTAKGYEAMKASIMDEVKQVFRPEFINRVDEMIVFHELERADIERIAALMLDDVRKRLAEQGVQLEVEPEAVSLLASEGYDPLYGARPLRRAIQRLVEDALSVELLLGNIRLGGRVRMSVIDGRLTFEQALPEPVEEVKKIES